MTLAQVTISGVFLLSIHSRLVSSACSDGHISCVNNQRCIKTEYVCDGYDDCWDGEDEKGCSSCKSGAFWCDNGCKRGIYKCDGHQWCDDGTDERNCSEYGDLFVCKDSTTRLKTVRCDGRYDCPHWDDEQNCTAEDCQGGAFFCEGRCFHPSHKCDGVRICPQGEDEDSCSAEQVQTLHDPCESGQFYCAFNDRCIPGDAVCDGVNDCYDMSDENRCESCSANAFMRGNRCMNNATLKNKHRTTLTPEPEVHEKLFSCDGDVFPVRLRCDGVKHCMNGWDERFCDTETSEINLSEVAIYLAAGALATLLTAALCMLFRWHVKTARYSAVKH